jgi:biotin operon repressor
LRTYCKGRGNAKSSAEIQRTLGISGNELRHQINRLRRKGAPIGSCKEGYFYAVTAGEMYSTIRQLQRMAAGLNSAILGLEQAMNRFVREDGDTLMYPCPDADNGTDPRGVGGGHLGGVLSHLCHPK